jgi:hypothetical protein
MRALRERCRRVLQLPAPRLTQECIDYLQNPEVLVAEFAESFAAAAGIDERERAFTPGPAAGSGPAAQGPWADPGVLRAFSAPFLRLESELECDEYDFCCLARNVSPLANEVEPGTCLDYVGLTCDETSTPILGVICTTQVGSRFRALLRLLAGLAELAPDAQLERADRFLFQRSLGRRIPFDLHLLHVGEDPPAKADPLDQLCRDLAFVSGHALRAHPTLPPVVRHILCLRIPSAQDAVTGILSEEWRV